MKQETLEEASKRAVKSGLFKDETLFIAGAKWQQERNYSEEEVLTLIRKYQDKFGAMSGNSFFVTDWFEQFKKK